MSLGNFHLSRDVKLNYYGTVFRAVDVKPINESEEELKKERIPTIDKTTIPQDTLDISYKTTQKLKDSSLVAFKDPMNEKWVILSLKNDTIDELKKHFGESDFYKKENGIIRLNNKAEAYVAGWYADIAYKRGFLSADSNHDGVLDDDEYRDTNNSYYYRVDMDGSFKTISETIETTYNKSILHRNHSKNIDEELDITLKSNKNFDGNITMKEDIVRVEKMYGVKNKYDLETKLIKEMYRNGAISFDDFEEIKMIFGAKQNKKLKALMKLKTNPSSLTMEEKKLVSAELEKLKNKNGKIDNNKLNEMIKTMKVHKKYLEMAI